MDEESNATALALRSVESTVNELDPTNLRLKANLEATSTSLGQSLSDKTLVNHDTTRLQDSPADDIDQLQAPSLGSFRAHLFSKFGRKHERPIHIPRPKGPMGLNTLYDPGDIALVDIIFVHGLGGDSKKTWSGSRDIESFWPQDWLPNDPSFKTARIHSFGYDANWRDRRLSILSIHDFGQDLLGEMKNHPSIRRSNTNFVLIGHSMGGNIAKAAYVLARQSPTSDKLASRFHSIIFLGTPHRGSNLAKIGRNILQVMGVSKPYLDDLSANSSYLTDLNALFQPYAADLHIWSFFETRPVTERPAIVLVDKFSATLGYSHEEVLPLDADHRHICKFNSVEDPNYRKVRNALSRAVEMIQLKDEPYSATASRARLEKYLDTDDSYQDDLFNCQNAKLPGSCVWFTEHATFTEWLESDAELSISSPILWLTGPPGTGKSIIFGHVVDFIKAKDAHCEYYFFRKGQANSNGLGPFLLHIAYQMALNDPTVRRKIFKLQDNSVSWQLHDEKTVWRKLFVDGIFQSRLKSTHYWLIDGIDECSSASAFFKLASQIPDSIRIFVTSRNTPEIELGIGSMGLRVLTHSLSVTDTATDIQAVIHAGLEILSLHDIAVLEPKLLERASGSFMWIRLVLQELETAFTEEDVEDILNEVPNDLYKMYERILHTIENERRRAKVAKSILFFVVLAVRSLTLDELCHAIQYELGQTLHRMDQVIALACSQFITVNHRDRVQIVHETAREFLLSERLNSALAIPRCQGHSRFASLCISYMDVQFQHLPGHSQLGASNSHQNEAAFFLKYASSSFSQHLLEADRNSSELFNKIVGFLNVKGLFWIEYIASESSIGVIPRTSMDLARYIREEMQDIIPRNFEKLKAWVTDLSRVVFTFQNQLLIDPSIIHDLIPPLCPTSSMVPQSALSLPLTIGVSGTQDLTWDDCLLRIPTDQEVDSVGYGEMHFAIGLADGEISIYDSTSMQLHISVVHPGSNTWQLEFGNRDKYLVSSGRYAVSVWDVKTGSELHRIPCSSPKAINLENDELHIVLGLNDGDVISRNLLTSESRSRKWLPPSAASESWPWQDNRLQEIVFSNTSSNILAASFYTKDVYLFDINGSNLLGTCVAHEDSIIRAMMFNPQHDILAVSYVNGSLAAFDSSTMARTLVLPDVLAHVLSWSADGRYLIVGTQSSAAHHHTIEVYELGLDIDCISLNIIYRANYPHKVISQISAAKHGIRFASIHVTDCRIWDLSSSLYAFRKSQPASQDGDTAILSSQHLSVRGEITAMVLSEDGIVGMCGTERGEIWAFSTMDGSEISVLHRAQVPRSITRIALAELENQDLIIKCDGRGLVTILVSSHSPKRWMKAVIIARYDLDRHTIEQLLVNPTKNRLLIMAPMITTTLELPSGRFIKNRNIPKYKTKKRAAYNCPSDTSQYMVFEDDSVYLLSWNDDESDKGQKLEILREGDDASVSPPTYTLHFQGNGIYVESLAYPLEGNRINCWDSSQFSASREMATVTPHAGLQHLTDVLKDALLVFNTTLIFVDYNSWVCTLDLKTFASTCIAKRHFFLLPEWTETYGRPLAAMTPKQDLIFVNLHRVVVVKKWMTSAQTLVLEPDAGDWRVISRRVRDESAVLGKG